MRPARYYKPYSVTLQKFTHERYAGTEIPKNFASRVTLIDPERSVNRDVLIYMNHPLRYRGETYYQAGFQKDDSATILQVVHNPSFIAPYVACVIVAAGLLVQFGYHLVGFSPKTNCAGMKRFFPGSFCARWLWRRSSWLSAKDRQGRFDLAKFGKIPVLVGGRVKPLDTVARNSLLIIHGKQELAPRRRPATQRDAMAGRCAFQRAGRRSVSGASSFKTPKCSACSAGNRATGNISASRNSSPFLRQIDEQGAQSEKLESVQRSAYQNAILNLRNALVLYQRLKNSVQPEGAENFAAELEAFESGSRLRGKRRVNARREQVLTRRNSTTWRN